MLVALGLLVWRLLASLQPALRRFAGGIAALAALQVASGLSNVVLDWPLLAALLHTAGAAALAVLLAVLLARAYAQPPAASREPAPSRPLYENQPAT